MSSITATLDGQTLVVDLDQVSCWDAIAYQATGLGALELVVAGLTDPNRPLLASELAVVAWLWHRQNGHPNVSVEAVARTIRLLADTEPPAPVAAVPDPPAPAGAGGVVASGAG